MWKLIIGEFSMDMDITNIILSLVGGLITFGAGFVGWYIKKSGSDVEKLKDKMQLFEVEVARSYVTKFELSELKNWLNEEFKDLKLILKDKKDKDG